MNFYISQPLHSATSSFNWLKTKQVSDAPKWKLVSDLRCLFITVIEPYQLQCNHLPQMANIIKQMDPNLEARLMKILRANGGGGRACGAGVGQS